MGVIQVTLFDCWRVGNGGNVLTAMLDQQTNPKVGDPLQFLWNLTIDSMANTKEKYHFFGEKWSRLLTCASTDKKQNGGQVLVTQQIFLDGQLSLAKRQISFRPVVSQREKEKMFHRQKDGASIDC